MEIARIDRFLEDAGLSELFKITTSRPFYFTGSALLRCLVPHSWCDFIRFGSKWKPNDIDIQCSEDDFDAVVEHVGTILGKKFLTQPIIEYVYNYDRITGRRCFVTDTFKIDVVGVKGDVLDHVRGFDLTCCQNAYNGSLVMFHPRDVENRVFSVVPKKHNAKLEGRIRKYEERGFTRV